LSRGKDWDVVIIGAGPAGLAGATYLGRFRRKVLVIDGSTSRARWIPESQNIPGFCHGIGGTELLAQMKAQALHYGAEIRAATVEAISATEGAFLTHFETEVCRSPYVLLATGVKDELPAIAGVEEAILRKQLKICPICDAFEATGARIAVIGSGEHGDREAEFLVTYSERITLIHIDGPHDPAATARLRRQGIEVIEAPMAAIELAGAGWRLRLPREEIRTFDVCYAALGCTPRHALAAGLGAHMDDKKSLTVNAHQETSVRNLYAAGDVVRGLNQVVVAAAEAAIAATDIHNKLRRAHT